MVHQNLFYVIYNQKGELNMKNKNIKDEFEKLLYEYNNRGASSSSNKNLIVAKLKSFVEVRDTFEKDKSEAIPFLKGLMGSNNASEKIVACVLFKGIEKDNIKKTIEIYPISKCSDGLSMENYADYFVKFMGDNTKTEHIEHIEDFNY